MFSLNNLASKAFRYETCSTRVHTVLSATKHEPYLPLLPSRTASSPFGRYSLPLLTHGGMTSLSLLDCDKLSAPEAEHPIRSPFRVLTKPGIKQLVDLTNVAKKTTPNRHMMGVGKSHAIMDHTYTITVGITRLLRRLTDGISEFGCRSSVRSASPTCGFCR